MLEIKRNLYYKVYFQSMHFPSLVTVEVLREYRYGLTSLLTPTDEQRWEIEVTGEWIVALSCHFSDCDTTEDLTQQFFDNYLIGLLPQLELLFAEHPYYFCLHHALITLGLQRPMQYSQWLDWFRKGRQSVGITTPLNRTGTTNACKYLTDHTITMWVYKDYQAAEHKHGPLARNQFNLYDSFCHELARILLFQMAHP